jgi:peptide/nickel transport system permease protein
VRYILNRVGFLLLTVWAALTLNFLLPRLMPGDPAQVMLARFQGQLNPEAIYAIQMQFGINTQESIFAQYAHYWQQLFRGDLGISLAFYPTPVSEVLGQAIPWTLGLVGAATITSFLIGTGIGVSSAWRHGKPMGDAIVPSALFLNAVPYYWFAMLILYVFGFVLGWFPLIGGKSLVITADSVVVDVLYHSFLPYITIVITSLGGWIVGMRNNMLSVMGEDYVQFAFAKGLPDGEIERNYAARNAILPAVTGFTMALGFVIGGALLTEIVFSYPGVGYILFQGVNGLDYPVMQGVFMFISVSVLLANFLTEIAYVFLDPRIRSGGSGQ